MIACKEYQTSELLVEKVAAMRLSTYHNTHTRVLYENLTQIEIITRATGPQGSLPQSVLSRSLPRGGAAADLPKGPVRVHAILQNKYKSGLVAALNDATKTAK